VLGTDAGQADKGRYKGTAADHAERKKCNDSVLTLLPLVNQWNIIVKLVSELISTLAIFEY
jgi:hypothetical protein